MSIQPPWTILVRFEQCIYAMQNGYGMKLMGVMGKRLCKLLPEKVFGCLLNASSSRWCSHSKLLSALPEISAVKRTRLEDFLSPSPGPPAGFQLLYITVTYSW